MIRLRSTRNCPNTARVLVGLEETRTPYEITAVPDGTFTREYGIPGPDLVDGDVLVVELGALVRHVARAYGAGTLWPADLAGQAAVDRWFELVRRIAGAVMSGEPRAPHALLTRVEAQLADKEWLVGPFTMADCGFVGLLPYRARLPMDDLPATRAYLDRLAARESVVSAHARVPR